MKKLLFVLFAGLVILLSNGLKAQDVFQPYKTNAVPYHGYMFPIFPGTERWIYLTYEERLESVQLPIDTLESISTARLLETCIYCPFFVTDVYAFNDQIQQIGKERNFLNCVDEFFNRTDCLSELLSLYSSREISFVNEIENPYDQVQYTVDYEIMELMMAYLNTIREFSPEERTEIVSLLREKMVRWDLYSVYSSNWVVYYLIDALSTGINEIGISSIYPNPTNGIIHIDNEISNVQIYNALGQLVKETKDNLINLSAQETGIYILKVITPSGVVTKQIIKN